MRPRLRVLRRIAPERIGQRFEPGLAGDLRLGAALGLEGEIEILQTRLCLGLKDARAQSIVELALGFNALGGWAARPLFEVTQIGQPLIDIAQLCIIEPPVASSRFLARNERHVEPSSISATARAHLVRAHPSSCAIR